MKFNFLNKKEIKPFKFLPTNLLTKYRNNHKSLNSE